MLGIGWLLCLAVQSEGTNELKSYTDISHRSQQTHSDSVKPGEYITVDLPGLPEDAKKLEMVLIPAGSFTMGSPKGENGRSSREWPPHPITITKPFYLGKYELTQAQWIAVTGIIPKTKHIVKGPNHPIAKLSWNQCRTFIKKLNALKQGTFRLPTEAEWEYACRAGTDTPYSFGDNLDNADRHLWWSGNNNPKGAKEVGLKQPNLWGLFDMHGNVYEWCSDRWEKPHQRDPQTDPQGPSTKSLHTWWTNHVNRGGSFMSDAEECRSASRGREQAFDYHYSLGFRIVRETS